MTSPIRLKRQQLQLQDALLHFAEEAIKLNSGANAEVCVVKLIEDTSERITEIFNAE